MVVHRNNNVKNSFIFSSPLIENSSSFFHSTNKKFIHIPLFQLHKKKFVYKIIGHCSGVIQLHDQMFW